MKLQGVVFKRIGQNDTVFAEIFAVFVAVYEVVTIGVVVAVVIGLLDASA